jgi:hypothetical protein
MSPVYQSTGSVPTDAGTTTGQPLNFRNSTNTSTYATILASKTYTGIVADAGILNITGKTSSDPGYLKSGRLLPTIHTTNVTSITCNLSETNNHHITTTADLATVNLTNPVVGQSGHIVIKNGDANTHSVTWQIGGGNTGYIKWQSGTAPTLTSTSGSYDIISYYCFTTTEILMATSTNHV